MTEHQRWFWRMDALERCLNGFMELNAEAFEIWNRDHCSPMQVAERSFRYRMKFIAEAPEWLRDLLAEFHKEHQ